MYVYICICVSTGLWMIPGLCSRIMLATLYPLCSRFEKPACSVEDGYDVSPPSFGVCLYNSDGMTGDLPRTGQGSARVSL